MKNEKELDGFMGNESRSILMTYPGDFTSLGYVDYAFVRELRNVARYKDVPCAKYKSIITISYKIAKV